MSRKKLERKALKVCRWMMPKSLIRVACRNGTKDEVRRLIAKGERP